MQLALYREGATRAEMQAVIARIWALADTQVVTRFLDPPPAAAPGRPKQGPTLPEGRAPYSASGVSS